MIADSVEERPVVRQARDCDRDGGAQALGLATGPLQVAVVLTL